MAEYTLPALTAANINGIVTAGQDGTYNITYTNLTSNQIQSIGQAFEEAMEGSLTPIAIGNGDYNDLTVKPGIPNGYTQSSNFNKVAFSGKASDLDNDSNFLTAATNAYTGSVASEITSNDIQNWNNKSEFSGNYEDLNEIPDFSLVALTGNYEDLRNKPNLLNIIDLSTFLNLNATPDDINKIQNLGDMDSYILNLNSYKDINNLMLSSAIINITNNYINNQQKSFFINNNHQYEILNITRTLINNDETNPAIIILDYINPNINNYLSIRTNNNNITDDLAQDQLDDITITPQIGTLIFDFEKNIIYCKVK